MKTSTEFKLTREKHLDHMVRVVPFIVFCYAVQCFIILKVSPTEFSAVSLSILGGFLALMIAGFISYDLKHQVILKESLLEISFLTSKKTILSYDEIWSIELKDPGQTFSSVILLTSKGKFTFYFADDAEKIQAWIESRKTIHQKAA